LPEAARVIQPRGVVVKIMEEGRVKSVADDPMELLILLIRYSYQMKKVCPWEHLLILSLGNVFETPACFESDTSFRNFG
jgi:hypothetical protein